MYLGLAYLTLYKYHNTTIIETDISRLPNLSLNLSSVRWKLLRKGHGMNDE